MEATVSPGNTEESTTSDNMPPKRSSAVAAAAMILLLDETEAVTILEQLTADEARFLNVCVPYVDLLNRDDLMSILTDFSEEFRNTAVLSKSYQDRIQRHIRRTLNRDQALTLIEKSERDSESDIKKQSILESLKVIQPEILGGMLQGEPLQLQAAVLSCLSAEQGAHVMRHLPTSSHEELVYRIADLEGISQPSLEAIATILHNYIEEARSEGEIVLKGVQQVADIMNLMDRDSTVQLLDEIRTKDKVLVDNIERRMLLFEHLIRLSPEDIRKLLADVDQTTLATALKGANDDIKNALLSGLSKRAKIYTIDEMEGLGALRKSNIDDARREILKRVERLLAMGEIELVFTQDAVVE